MLKNYVKIAWRNLVKNRAFTLINALGLSVGLAVCLIIALFVVRELTFDSFHEGADRIYRVVAEETESGDIRTGLMEDIAMGLAEAYPEVESWAVSTTARELLVSANGRQFYENSVRYVNPGYLEPFSFPVAHGSVEGALESPRSVVITRPFAEKYFGSASVVGETITTRDESTMRLEGDGLERIDKGETTYTVAAVLETLPYNSSITFDMLIPFQPESGSPYWWNFGNANYIKLRADADIAAFRDKLPAFMENQQPEGADEQYDLRVQPLTDAHLYPSLGTATRTGPLQYIYIFSAAALLILLIAVVNYMNLSTARSSQRAREVGVRKVMGGHRGQLLRQFLMESVLLSTISMLAALLMAELALPTFNRLLDTRLSMQPVWEPLGLAVVAAVAVIVGLLSGSYSAFVLSGVSPSRVLKGLFPGGAGSSRFRKVLVVGQFTGSIMLILASVTIYNQMEHIRKQRLNVRGDQVLVVENKNEAVDQQYDTFKRELLSSPAIESVTAGQMPGDIRFLSGFTPSDTTSQFDFLNVMWVEYDYFSTLGYEMVAGTHFRDAGISDLEAANAKIINETLANVEDLWDKVGQEIQYNGTGILVGIVEDYHIESMHQPIEPLVAEFQTGSQETILVRLADGQVSGGLEAVRRAWNRHVTDRPFYYHFLDEQLDRQYRTEQRLANIFWVFTVIAIFIACLGLLGLSAYTAERRTKEIGVRKVLGATVSGIVVLLSRDYLKLVALGFVIAAPAAYYVMGQWLADFAYRITIGPGIFLAAGGTALLVALATVIWQSLKAATANPVDSLRSE
ncbi:MAG: ABC transporter permease [Balneolaceae bacterium]|nr:ABC transporter permease [Balneolaceae bacterium]